jgi:hypothetical protein
LRAENPLHFKPHVVRKRRLHRRPSLPGMRVSLQSSW